MNLPRRSGAVAISILLAAAAFAPRPSAEAGFIAVDLGSSSPPGVDSLAGPNDRIGLGHGPAVESRASGRSSFAFGPDEPGLGAVAGADVVGLLSLGGSDIPTGISTLTLLAADDLPTSITDDRPIAWPSPRRPDAGHPDAAYVVYTLPTPPSAALLGVGLLALGGYRLGRGGRAR